MPLIEHATPRTGLKLRFVFPRQSSGSQVSVRYAVLAQNELLRGEGARREGGIRRRNGDSGATLFRFSNGFDVNTAARPELKGAIPPVLFVRGTGTNQNAYQTVAIDKATLIGILTLLSWAKIKLDYASRGDFQSCESIGVDWHSFVVQLMDRGRNDARSTDETRITDSIGLRSNDNDTLRLELNNIAARYFRYCFNVLTLQARTIELDFGKGYHEGFLHIRTATEAELNDSEVREGAPRPCARCGANNSNTFVSATDGSAYCEPCWRALELPQCDRCHTILPNNVQHQQFPPNTDMRRTASFCRQCYSRVCIRCCRCGDRYIHTQDMHAGSDWRENVCGDWVCRDCQRGHVDCADCGRIIPADSVVFEDDDEQHLEPLCGNCHGMRHGGCENVIHGHAYKPKAYFHKMPGENTQAYYGVELEVELTRDGDSLRGFASEFRDRFADNEHVLYIKRDGSLDNGFEIVTHPCTLNFHKYKLSWYEMCEWLITRHFRSHNVDTCGLHVHVSKRAFTEAALGRLCWFLEFNQDKVIKLARRSSDQWCRFKKVKGLSDAEQSKYKDATDQGGSRYCALNLYPRHTLEFRFPKGTLNPVTILATLEFVDAVRAWVHTISWATLVQNKNNWTVFCNWLAAHAAEYPVAIGYMQRRGAWQGPAIENEKVEAASTATKFTE